jgi:hypothetical protein
LSFSLLNGRRVRAAVAIAGVLLVSLTACSSGSSPAKKDSTSAGTLFPAVAGGYGTKPTLTFPKNQPSATLQVKVLSTGKGPVVVTRNLVVVDYLGQIWQGKVFDNSYDRKTPLGTPIGIGSVIKGWDQALVGKHVGDRILMVVPPALGYGTTGNTSAGIKGTDSLAFVVDIVSQFGKTDVGDTKAVPQAASTAPVTVKGALGAQPTLTVVKGSAPRRLRRPSCWRSRPVPRSRQAWLYCSTRPSTTPAWSLTRPFSADSRRPRRLVRLQGVRRPARSTE